MPQKNVDVKASYTQEGEAHTLTVNLKPKWEGVAADRLQLSTEQKQQLTMLYYAEALTSFNVGTVGKTNAVLSEEIKNIDLRILSDGSMQLARTIEGEQGGFLANKANMWNHFPGTADMVFDRVSSTLVKDCVVFDDVTQLFKASEEWLPAKHPENDPLIKEIANSPDELGQINKWLADHGIQKVNFLNEGSFSLILEANGTFVVRIQSKKEPKPYSKLPQVMQSVFSTETEHAYIDIVPKMPGRSLGGKNKTSEVEALENALLSQGEIFDDAGAKNVMLLPDGTPIIVDMSAVRPSPYKEKSDSATQDASPYEWVNEDGVPKLHLFCPLLADNSPDKKERFVREAMDGGEYAVCVASIDAEQCIRKEMAKVNPVAKKCVETAMEMAAFVECLASASLADGGTFIPPKLPRQRVR